MVRLPDGGQRLVDEVPGAPSVLGGADYGAGFWDLTAGGARRGAVPRGLIDRTLAPVWEANHVWLIFCLVVLWTAFSSAFAAIMTTLFIPLGLAALGIVVRGSGFAFRKQLVHTEQQRAAGAAFATSSILTPFFLGTVAGGIASGRVPGTAVSSWVNPTSLLGGVLAVLVTAFVAAVFLTAEARRLGEAQAQRWFTRRARISALVTGAVSLAGIAILHSDAPRLFSGLTGRGLPLIILSGLAGLACVLFLHRLPPRTLQLLAVTAAATVVAGWGVAQYPFLLGTHTSIAEAAAPDATLLALVVIAAGALVLVVPSVALLFTLQQRGSLEPPAH